jgi:hypothetical protein
MKTLLKSAVVVAIMTALCPSLMAQWAAWPTPNVPKTATGEPNLTAPAPRTPEGKVDFSGIWQSGRGGGGGGQRGGGAQRGAGANAAAAPATPDAGRGGANAAAAPATPDAGRGGAQRGAANAANAAAPAEAGGRGGAAAGGQRGGGQRGAPALPADGIPIATFGNAGGAMPGDLPFQPWAKELMEKRRADNSKDNPDAHCLPMGFMQFHNHPEPRKIIQTKDVILIIYEANSGLRQIFMDGRSLPGPDAEPWWYGYSVGKWEGDTLVVETRGFRDGEWLDVRGSPLTDMAKVTEKFRRTNYGELDIEITVDDPKAYTKPWTVRVYQRAMLNTELIEFICEDRDATHYVGAAEAPK